MPQRTVEIHAPSATEWDRLQTRADAWHLCPETICPQTLEDECLAWLSPAERNQHQRHRTAPLRHAWLLSRALCRSTLSHYTGVDPADWQFTHNPFGKPAVAAPHFPDLRFNLTGTAGLACCLVTRAGEVGIDAEETSQKHDIAQVARHFFSPAERATLPTDPPTRTRRFYELWVLKEAYLKGIGCGLSRSPESFTIEFDASGHAAPLDGWQLTLHQPTPRHAAAVAMDGRTARGPIPVIWRAAENIF